MYMRRAGIYNIENAADFFYGKLKRIIIPAEKFRNYKGEKNKK